jgi:septum formation protein
MVHKQMVLASGSRYRAGLLADHGFDVEVDPPGIDERALDHLFDQLQPHEFALDLARRKALAVARRHPGSLILAADQVGVLHTGTRRLQLTKQPDEESAVAQLMAMSGTTHELVNGVVVARVSGSGAIERSVQGVDVQSVTMRSFSEADARAYVRRFEPYDSSGSYRLEDQEQMEPGAPFVTDVQGEDPTGVLGLPMPLLGRLLVEIDRSG